MFAPITLACLAFIATSTATTVGKEGGAGFCYRDSEGCGPTTSEWAPLCHSGNRQSPINLPMIATPGLTTLKLGIYKGDSFRVQNNGHSIQLDFDNKGPSSQPVSFPDPLKVSSPINAQDQKLYKFASAHFHWGITDFTQGSEHCIASKCAAMELHLVHYLANYSSMAEAVASKDESALTVLGVLIDMSVGKTLLGGALNAMKGQNAKTAGTGNIKGIVDNLHEIEHADHDTTKFTTINQSLDLSKFLFEAYSQVYSYKGSLTTPGCNEQVNWFVFKRPATTSHQDLEAFRSILKDGRGKTLNENHRPVQPLKGRQVFLSNVLLSV